MLKDYIRIFLIFNRKLSSFEKSSKVPRNPLFMIQLLSLIYGLASDVHAQSSEHIGIHG